MKTPLSTFSLKIAPWLGVLACAACACAAGGFSTLEEAVEPLDAGVPEVAVVKLQAQLATALEPDARKRAKTKLAEALLAVGRPAEALKQVSDPEVAAPLLEARIDAALGRWPEALAIYNALPPEGNGPDATLGKAECLRELGRMPEAIQLLESRVESKPGQATLQLRLAELYLEQNLLKKCDALLPSIQARSVAEQKWRQYVEAQLRLEQGHPAYAYGRFESLLHDPVHGTVNLVTGAVLGMTESRAKLNGPSLADDILELFIGKNPENPHLGILFRKLDEIYAGEENPSQAELQKWAQRDEPAWRAGFASYYLAKAYLNDGKRDRALKLLDAAAKRFPGHPILAAARLMQGQILMDEGKFGPAQTALDAAMRAAKDERQRAKIEMAAATAHFQAGEFVLAATVFRAAGERAPSLWQGAVFNSALSWLHQGNYPKFMADYKDLSRLFPESPYRRELILEEALLQARQGDPRAEATLHQFLRDFPDNPRAPEANLALAELRFAGNDAAGANAYLKVVNELPAPSQTAAQADYLAIFVADAATPRDDDKVIALCLAFAERYPGSPHLAEVRMKLGQVYFRREDFASAQTQFETIAKETPDSPLVETSRFLAAQSSLKRMDSKEIDRAIELFEEVAKMNGPLKLHARLQQALAQNRLGKQNEALILYDAILASDPPPDVKFAALAGKAENLVEMGRKEKQFCEQALAIYEGLAAEPGVSAIWRNQALYKKGRCLETLGRPEEALAAYYDVLQSRVAGPAEYFWFYKAGFDAGRLCEAQEQWKSAIGIYQKMSAMEGPPAEEAKARMGRLRLEHFIWE